MATAPRQLVDISQVERALLQRFTLVASLLRRTLIRTRFSNTVDELDAILQLAQGDLLLLLRARDPSIQGRVFSPIYDEPNVIAPRKNRRSATRTIDMQNLGPSHWEFFSGLRG